MTGRFLTVPAFHSRVSPRILPLPIPTSVTIYSCATTHMFSNCSVSFPYIPGQSQSVILFFNFYQAPLVLDCQFSKILPPTLHTFSCQSFLCHCFLSFLVHSMRNTFSHIIENVNLSVVSYYLLSHGVQATRPPCSQDSPGKITGVGSHSLLQGIFQTLRLNPGLLHCRQILCDPSNQGSLMGNIKLLNTVFTCQPHFFSLILLFFTLHHKTNLQRYL